MACGDRAISSRKEDGMPDENPDDIKRCMQPVNGRPCNRPSKWGIMIKTVIGANDRERTFKQVWTTCGDHAYDFEITVNIQDVKQEE